MFGIGMYLSKIFEIEWKFNPNLQKYLEETLFVEFSQKENGYFVIKNVMYSYVDILQGLENIDFVFTKCDKEYKVEVLDTKK